MNRLLLSATVQAIGAMRYTPAALPVLDLTLRHESQLGESGSLRQVTFELKAVAIGDVTEAIRPLGLGQAARFGGFLSGTRNGRGVLFHITELDIPSDPASSPGAPL